MIKGLYSGYSGLIYVYYRGPQQVVLSDVNAGFRMAPDALASTALRIVLRPNTWTEINYSYVASSFEDGKGILYNLEKSGYVDIYTDPLEVAKLKTGAEQPKAIPVDVSPTSEHKSDSNGKYFNMSLYTQQDTKSEEYNTMLKMMAQQNELMKKNMESMSALTQAMTQVLLKVSDKLDKGEK